MPAVTQRIDNYLGGVSKQSDDKKIPGQVRECLNAYPDPTFGLTKRPGFKWIKNLGTGTTYDSSKWFYIARDDDEKYVGCITPATRPTITVTGNGTSGAENKYNLATTTSGSGSGMTVNLTAVGGVVTAIAMNLPGTGYAANDTITIAAATAGTGANVTGTLSSAVTLGDIDIWNALTGVACTVTYGSAAHQRYLTAARKNYDVLTVQDTTIITNKLVSTATIADPSFVSKTRATLVLSGAAIATETYSVTINGTTITPVTVQTNDDYDDILGDLKTQILALSVTGLTAEIYNDTIELSRVVSGTRTAFTISAKGGPDNSKLKVFQDQVDNVSQLPTQSFHDHIVKVINTSSTDDTYFAKFVADDGVSGTGFWQETLDPSKSTGLEANTMPHELVNPALNTFIFREVTWVARKVGDDDTNSHPSFVGFPIQHAFFYNNRLGFLSEDNVSMSQSKDFYNFYHTSAQTITDSDPVDLSCSTIRPAALHAVIPTTQGLVLFSKNQQFMLTSANGILTPTTTTIQTISNYEVDTEISPVDMGNNLNFLSKTPSYTRIFGMVTRGQDENPQVLDIGRVINEWIPETVDTFVASPQNQFLAMSDQTSRKIYFYRLYNDGEKNIVEAWFNWELPGTVQTIAVDQDSFFAVTKQGNQFTLSKASMSQSPLDAIIVNNDGQKVNPCIDLYAPAASVKYQGVETLKVTAGGSGYSSAPTVTITGSGTGPGAGTPGSGATATATVSGGAVTALTLTAGGSGYENGAVVSFSGGGGSSATATASVFEGSKCYIEYENDTSLTPVILIAGDVSGGSYVESGFTITPEISSDGAGSYLKVPSNDFSSVAANVYTGWKYDLDIILPRTYFRGDENMKRTDFTAALTVSRMKFACGLSGVMGFKLKSTGRLQGSKSYRGDGSTTDFSWIEEDISYVDRDQIKVKVNNVVKQSTDFTFLNDTSIRMGTAPKDGETLLIYIDEWYNLNPTAIANTYLASDIALAEQSVFTIPIHQKNTNFQLRVFNDSPFPVSLNSMMWEGNYSPQFYRRR